MNIINDGYNTTSNYLKYTMQLYNYFQPAGIVNLQDAQPLQLMSSSSQNQFNPAFGSSYNGQNLQMIYTAKYDMNLYYFPQEKRAMMSEEAMGEY